MDIYKIWGGKKLRLQFMKDSENELNDKFYHAFTLFVDFFDRGRFIFAMQTFSKLHQGLGIEISRDIDGQIDFTLSLIIFIFGIGFTLISKDC